MQRLKTRSQFQAVLAGSTVARTAHFALHRVALDGPVNRNKPLASVMASDSALFALSDVWLGAMVAKRWAKRAVTRNAIKRQIYSVSSEFEAMLPVAAHVVRLRAVIDSKQFISATSAELKMAVRLELQQLFARATARSQGLVLMGGAS
ncbi:MAG: ribonuclease P protein component [Rhodoferax sp.]|uniref:ribonuclease P protein component n=1 Tax=Rhodoferax sp. TaxID=50421 RepID=UPI002635661C|nr:ribonuclease P protein component [Rhodoferax sp.]MDD5336820.1 ribonuclease P protein component [Rhodoferax sp.]